MKTWVRRLVVAGALLGLVGLVALEGMRYSASRRGVETVALPLGSEVARLAASADYTDAYRVALARPEATAEDVLGLRFDQGGEIVRTENEIVYEGTAPGLRFLASYFFEPGPTGGFVTLSTAVFYKSALGRLYFTPVGFGHRRLVPFAVSRIPE